MKTEFKAKFLQHLNERRRDKGFTLIELLVVIIIIGILSAIALPSFLNQANKAKQSEAKQYLSSINKGQQAYYAENTKFTNQITGLGLGLKEVTTNYSYAIGTTSNTGVSAGATAATGLRGYASAVGLVGSGEGSTTQTVLCEGDKDATPVAPIVGANDLTCGAAFSLVTK